MASLDLREATLPWMQAEVEGDEHTLAAAKAAVQPGDLCAGTAVRRRRSTSLFSTVARAGQTSLGLTNHEIDALALISTVRLTPC